MSTFIHMLVLKTREGTLVQRADAISTILEVKGGSIILVLANNMKVELTGETMISLLQKLHECGGLPVLLHRDGEALGLEAMAREAALESEPA